MDPTKLGSIATPVAFSNGELVRQPPRTALTRSSSDDDSQYPRYRVQFPSSDEELAQDEAYFYLDESGERHRIRFHDYREIFARQGLYEQIFYDRLKCTSPSRMADWLELACFETGESMQRLRVLDLGAGNGMMAEALLTKGVARTVGVDILPAAKVAADRDRPGAYDRYYVSNIADLDCETRTELEGWHFDCLTVVAALGFGDIPPEAFAVAFNLIRDDGWVVFNIKESFLDPADNSGFSALVRDMWRNCMFEPHLMVRYRHRYSIHGEPLHYYGVVGKKRKSIVYADVFGT